MQARSPVRNGSLSNTGKTYRHTCVAHNQTVRWQMDGILSCFFLSNAQVYTLKHSESAFQKFQWHKSLGELWSVKTHTGKRPHFKH